ncbi:YwaF family protein [Virgibacillus necropolis]|uniref:TIGR02206 family membrane protein n=1 Tax=Virgibacillus necropolis TaxID=163877 RepID=A0A221M8B6_9BACI|nr:TIGR02206 family membrane protein [Virgibacillus necropolis]ASN03871.1 TIGR02206 family membrane protein [Virgibacillus necropolis]
MITSWWSEETDYITVFGVNHIIYLVIVIAALFALLLNRNRVKANPNKIGNVILIVLIIQQILLYSWYLIETGFNLSESLPLHICRISTLLGMYFLLTKNKKALEIMFYFGLYAYGSFLYPQRIYPVYHVIGISFVVNHAVTILLPFYAYIAYNWRPRFSGVIRSYFIFLLYFVGVYFLNPVIDGNYFYLKYRPFFKEWPEEVYIAGVLVVTFVGFCLAFSLVRAIPKSKKESVKK